MLHFSECSTVAVNFKTEMQIEMGDWTVEHLPGRLDASAEDGAARGVDAEGGADDGERDGKPDAERRPHVRRRLGEEPAKVDAFPPTGELKVSSSVSA